MRVTYLYLMVICFCQLRGAGIFHSDTVIFHTVVVPVYHTEFLLVSCWWSLLRSIVDIVVSDLIFFKILPQIFCFG